MSPQSSHRPAKRLDLHIVDLYQLHLSARIVREFFVYAFAGGPHGVNDDGSIFPGKSNPLQTCSFLSRLLSGALSRTTQ